MTRLLRFLTGVPLVALVVLPIGCAKLQTVSDAQTAVDKTAAAIEAIKTKGATPASRNVAVQCAAQAIANAAGDMCTSTGHTSCSSIATQLSTWFGSGCL